MMMYGSDSSITHSEYHDRFIPHNDAAQFVKPPPNHALLRLPGGLISLQSQLQTQIKPQLQSQLQPQLQPSVPRAQLPLQTESQHFQTHCGTHLPPSYVDSDKGDDAGGGGGGGGGGDVVGDGGIGGDGSRIHGEMSDVSDSGCLSLQTPLRTIEHDMWPDRIRLVSYITKDTNHLQ